MFITSFFYFLAVLAHLPSAKSSLSEWANRGLRVSLFHTSKSPPTRLWLVNIWQVRLSISNLWLVSFTTCWPEFITFPCCPPQSDTHRHQKEHIFHQTCESLHASMFFQGSVEVTMCITTTVAKETKSDGYTDREMKHIETLWNRGNRKWHTVQYMTEQRPDNYKKTFLWQWSLLAPTIYEVM